MNLTSILLSASLIVLVYITLVYLLALLKKDFSVLDVAWGIGFIIVAVSSLLLNGKFLPKQLLVTGLVIAWGLRLSFYILFRNRQQGPDLRYQQELQKWGQNFLVRSFLQTFVLQGFLIILVTLPVTFINASQSGEVTILDLIGVLTWLTGFLFETIADIQLYLFKRNLNNKGKILTLGLWKYSRHPNYFGETLEWWGIYLLAITLPNGIVTLIGPLVLSWLVLKTAIPRIEKGYQGNFEYHEYVKTTSAFFPWFPNRSNMSKRLRNILILTFLVGFFLINVLPYFFNLPATPDKNPQSLAYANSKFVEFTDAKIHIQLDGPITGQPVILIHGFGGSTFSFRYTIPFLVAQGYRVVAIDLKGFGLSEKSFAYDYSHAAQADLIALVMNKLKIKQAVLIGHSMGGNVVAHFAEKYPEKTKALVIVDGALNETPGLLLKLSKLITYPPITRWAQIFFRSYFNSQNAGGILAKAYYNPELLQQEDVSDYQNIFLTKDWDLALVGMIRDTGQNYLSLPVSSIKVPVLLIWGANDTWVPLSQGEKLQAEFPNSKLVTIEQAGHLPLEENVKATNQQIGEFLKSL